MPDAKNTADLIKGALKRAGEVANGDSQYHSLALRYLNNAHLAVLAGSDEFNIDLGDPWSWARNQTPRSIVLLPAYETGTVSLVQGSDAGTFSSAPAVSQLNRFLKVTDRAAYYKITAHTAGETSFTLERAYIEETGTALAFISIPLIYDLGTGILRLVEKFRGYGDTTTGEVKTDEDGKISGMPLNAFRDQFPLQACEEGFPTRFATLRRDDSQWLVQFNRYPTSSTKVDFDCIEIPDALIDADDSFPVLPPEHRIALEFITAHWLSIDKDNDKKADYYLKLAQAKLAAMVKAERKQDTHTGTNKGRLLPRQEELGPSRRDPYSR